LRSLALHNTDFGTLLKIIGAPGGAQIAAINCSAQCRQEPKCKRGAQIIKSKPLKRKGLAVVNMYLKYHQALAFEAPIDPPTSKPVY
jgi:hypothetical protein